LACAAAAAALPIDPATGDWTLPRGGGLAAGARAGDGGVFGGGGALAAGLGGSLARTGAGGAFGAGALGGALLGGDSDSPPSSPRLRSREKMLMLPPDADLLHRPLARSTLGIGAANMG
jgi:hypothetical protein